MKRIDAGTFALVFFFLLAFTIQVFGATSA